MNSFKQFAGSFALLSIGLLAFCVAGILFDSRANLRAIAWNLRTATWNAAAASDNLAAATGELRSVAAQLADPKTGALAQVVILRRDLVDKSGAQVTQLVDKVDGQATQLRLTADRRLGDALARVDSALGTVEALHRELTPTLVNAAALIKDAQDSWDDSYDDVRGLLESSTVAATQIAQTAETVRAVAPRFAGDVSGIASDFHDATHNLDVKFFHPPAQTRWGKVKSFFATIETLAVAALRGGAI